MQDTRGAVPSGRLGVVSTTPAAGIGQMIRPVHGATTSCPPGYRTVRGQCVQMAQSSRRGMYGRAR